MEVNLELLFKVWVRLRQHRWQDNSVWEISSWYKKSEIRMPRGMHCLLCPRNHERDGARGWQDMKVNTELGLGSFGEITEGFLNSLQLGFLKSTRRGKPCLMSHHQARAWTKAVAVRMSRRDLCVGQKHWDLFVDYLVSAWL